MEIILPLDPCICTRRKRAATVAETICHQKKVVWLRLSALAVYASIHEGATTIASCKNHVWH